MNAFKGYRNIMINTAQILCVCILIPTVAIICSLLGPNNGASSFNSMIVSLIGEIPLCSILCSVLSQYMTGITVADVTYITVEVFLKAFPEAILVGVCVHFFVQLFEYDWNIFRISMKNEWERKRFRPLPILPSFLGIVFATILAVLLDKFQNDFVTIIAELGAIVVIIIGIKIMFGRRIRGIFSIKKILIYIIDGIFPVIVTAYVTAMLMISSGILAGLKNQITFSIVISGTLIISTALVLFIHYFESKDKGLI